MATVLACGGFGAICGSSIATAATMTKVAYPSMSEHGYSDELAAGVDRRRRHARHPDPAVDHHGDLRDHHRHQHRQAVRGRRAARAGRRSRCSASRVQYISWRDPTAGPRAERAGWRERLAALKDVWAVAVLFVIVMGGIYGGVFTATEGAGIGAFGAFVLRPGAPRALAARPVRGAGRQRAHDGDAVHDPGRRADLRQLHQLHDDARPT